MNVILPGADGKLHWTGAPDPVLGDGDVLLEVHAAALNRADLLQRDGNTRRRRDGRNGMAWKRPESYGRWGRTCARRGNGM